MIDKIIMILVFIVSMSSCTTTKYVEVPVETVKTEYKDRLIVDSIYVENNTDTKVLNDTVFITKYEYKYKYINKTDTVIKTDSIPKIVKVEVVKEVNILKDWQKYLMITGILSIVGIVLMLIKRFK